MTSCENILSIKSQGYKLKAIYIIHRLGGPYPWLARDVTVFSIFGYPPCWGSTGGKIYMCLLCIYAIAVYYTMSSLENERVPSLDELCIKIPILSEYCAKLEDNVKRRYVEKIAEIGVDPVTIPDQQFDTECLPPIEAMDLLSYLVLETSFYTKEQFKAYKSLEAYNFVVSGFLSGIQGCVVAGKHVVTGKVRH